jgi:uncharacterized protein (TIGR02117 family)
VYVVRREHHSGIAIAVADWPDPSWSVLAELPRARFVEFGWGDAVYYQAEKKTLRMTLAAILWPTASVMEVLAVDDVSQVASRDYEATEIRVSAEELATLAASIADSFAPRSPKSTGTVLVTTAGESRFFPAKGEFHFFRMCNRWTTERLASIGCAIRPWPVISATRALSEARRCAAMRRPECGDDSCTR